MVVFKVKPQQYFWMLCLQPWLVFTVSSLSRLHLVNLAFTNLDNLLLGTESNGKFSLARDLVKIITFKRLLVFSPFCYSFLPNTWRRVRISLNLLLSLISNEAARKCCSIPTKTQKNTSFLQCTSEVRVLEGSNCSALCPSLFSIFWDIAFEHRVLLFK